MALLAWLSDDLRLFFACWCTDLIIKFHLQIPTWSFNASTAPILAATNQAFLAAALMFQSFFFFFFWILQLRIYRDMGFWICVYWKKWGGSEFFYGDLNNSMLSDWRSRRLFIVWEIKELKASKTSGAGGFVILLKNSTVGSGNRTHGFSNTKPFALLVFVSSDLLNLLKIVRLFASLCWQAVVHVLFFLFYASKNMRAGPK